MIKKSEFIWNMIGSMCAAGLSMILLMFANRINGADMAGMFMITFSSATVLNSIADFGMRVFQVSDTDRRYSFGVYLSARWIVDLLMIVCGIAFVLISGYSLEKAALCMTLVLFRFIDGLSEAYQGEFQLAGRLDIAGKSVTYRMLAAMGVFLVIDLVTHNIFAATAGLTLANLIMLACFDLRLIGGFTKERSSRDYTAVKEVVIACFPLFFSTLLNNYIINAPKFAIDKLLTYDMQTYFNILYLPTFTINLMSIFVLKPMIKTLGEMWNGQCYTRFLKVVGKMSLAIVALTALVEAVCATIGLPILSVIYGVDLSQYKLVLLILVLSGGFSALAVVLFYTLTTMRAQGKVSIAYILSALGGLFIPNLLVARDSLMGAAVSSVLLTAILFVALAIIWLYEWKKCDKTGERK